MLKTRSGEPSKKWAGGDEAVRPRQRHAEGAVCAPSAFQHSACHRPAGEELTTEHPELYLQSGHQNKALRPEKTIANAGCMIFTSELPNLGLFHNEAYSLVCILFIPMVDT